MNELKLIKYGEDKRIYLHNGKYIDVDKFNQILDGWYYIDYNIKKYDMHAGKRHIFVWYVR